MNARALILGLALLTVSCSGSTTSETTATADPAPDSSELDDSTSSTAAPTTTTTAAPSTTDAPTTTAAATGSVNSKALARVVQAAAVTEAVESMSITMRAEMNGLPDMEAPVSFAMTAAMNTDGTGMVSIDLSAMLDGMSADGQAEAGPLLEMFANPIEMLVTDDLTYMPSSFLSWLVPVETAWIAVPSENDDAAPGFADDPPTADQFLPILRGLDDDVEELGREQVGGVETTHYRGMFSLERLAELGEEFDAGSLDLADTGAFSADVFDVEVWIDDEDYVRRLRFGVDDLNAFDPTMDAEASFWFTIEMADFGTRIEVEVPDDADVTFMDDVFG